MRDHQTEFPELQVFFEEEFIVETLGTIKCGKEADVVMCRGGKSADAELLAAKIYRPIAHRSFTNDALYTNGRFPTQRDSRAVVRKNNFKGHALRMDCWVEREYELLQRLHSRGADVPRVLTRSGCAVLMEFVGSGSSASPPLKQCRFDRTESQRLFEQVVYNIELMLGCDCVHGDLSEYNILLRDDGSACVIDFPQAVDARHNMAALELLERDLGNVTRFFGRFGVQADASAIARDLWDRYEWGDL